MFAGSQGLLHCDQERQGRSPDPGFGRVSGVQRRRRLHPGWPRCQEFALDAVPVHSDLGIQVYGARISNAFEGPW